MRMDELQLAAAPHAGLPPGRHEGRGAELGDQRRPTYGCTHRELLANIDHGREPTPAPSQTLRQRRLTRSGAEGWLSGTRALSDGHDAQVHDLNRPDTIRIAIAAAVC